MNSLKNLRKSCSLKQYEAADLLNITNDYLSMIENKKRSCSFKLINAMAILYKTSPEKIFLLINSK